MTKKKQYTLEYPIRTSPKRLYDLLSTPPGLSLWFADQVDIQNDFFLFSWNGTSGKARIIEQKANDHIRFQWDGVAKDEYLEFRISRNEITGDTALMITAFASSQDLEEEKLLWNSQVSTLIGKIGG